MEEFDWSKLTLQNVLSGIFDPITQPIRFSLGDPLSGNTFQAANPISEAQMAALVEHARTRGLTEEQLSRLFTQGSSLGATAAQIASMIDQFDLENRVTGEQQKISAAQEEYLKRARGFADDSINRFTKILSTPGAIKNDADYGAALADAENYINAQANTTQRQAAQSTSQSGLRSSGRSADLGLRAQETAAQQKSGVLSSLIGDVTGRLDAAKQLRADIEGGNVGTQFDLSQFGLAGIPNFNPIENILGIQLGQEQARRGLSKDALGTVIGTIQQGMDSAMNGITGIMGAFKK